MMKRPTKDRYYLNIAAAVSRRSTCLRRQYGAIIVKNDRIISTGYNGAPVDADHCTDRGTCWRAEHNIPHGEQYEKCRSVHAEANAIVSGYPGDMHDAALYLVGFENGKRMKDAKPCEMCARLIANAGIRFVITDDELYYLDRNRFVWRSERRED